MQSLLLDKVHGLDFSISYFAKVMNKNKTDIFHDKDVPKKQEVGQVHAVCLQLIAAVIVSLRVANHQKIGTNKLYRSHLAVFCPKEKRVRNGAECCRPVMYVHHL